MPRENINEQENQQFLRECCYIIEHQQSHIAKLQSDLIRKETIIANLLSKQESIRSKKQSITKGEERNLQVEKLTQQVYDLRSKYENSVYQIEAYELQIHNKNQQIADLCKKCQILEHRDKEIYEEAQEGKEVMARLKQAYEAKISMLLTELKKYVQEDVRKVHQKLQVTHKNQRQPAVNSKNTQAGNRDTNSSRQVEEVFGFQKQNEQAYRISTPMRVNTSNSKPSFLMSTGIASERKLLENTPYKNCSSFMVVNSKQFPHSATKASSNKLNREIVSETKEPKKSLRMLEHIKDAKFITDSYEDEDEDEEQEQEQSSSQQECVTRQKITQNNKVSIQRVIEQFSKYYTNYEAEREHPKPEKPQTEQTKEQRQSTSKRMKITHILNTLGEKIKRFQNEGVDGL